MNDLYQVDAPKRPLNLSVNTDLVAHVREFTDNLSGVVETLLVNYVKQKVDERDGHAQALTRAAQNWNNFVEKHGSFADEYSTL